MKRKFQNMPMRKKLIFTFAVLIALFLVAEVFCVVSIHSVQYYLHDFYDNQFLVVQAGEELSIDLQKYAKELARTAVAKRGRGNLTEAENLAFLEAKIQATRTNLENMGAGLTGLEKLEITDQDALATMRTTYSQLETLTEQTLAYYAQDMIDEGIDLANGELDEVGRLFGQAVEQMIQAENQESLRVLQAADRLVTILYVITVVLTVLIVAVAVFLGILLTRSVVGPLQAVQAAARRLSEGDLQQTLSYESGDEMGALADSIRETIAALSVYVGEIDVQMAAIGSGDLTARSDVAFRGDFISIKQSMDAISRNLTHIVTQINTSANQVLRGAEQIAASGQALSQATLEQASSVEELGETINDISAQVQNNAESAVSTNHLTKAVSANMGKSLEQMEALQRAIDQMRERSGKISEIINEIEDISFQTNILSLNAAVEAARAGEAGRGFSVVANEIRRLSAKTSDASRMTRDLLSESMLMTTESARLAGDVGEALAESAARARDAAEQVDTISQVCTEQATAVVQVRQSIDLISQIVQENSATAEESAASSEELTGQMQMLKELVSTFRFDGQDGHH